MTTPRQRINEIRARIKARHEGSEGRLPLNAIEEQSALERGVKGLGEGLTAPLDIVNLASEPDYGATGPGVAGSVGQLAGSVASYILAELALARVFPFLRGRALTPSASRSAIAQGAVDFARAPAPGETRQGAAVRGALTGAAQGAIIAPRLGTGGNVMEPGLTSVLTAGAAGAIIPAVTGGSPRSPVPITGNETADAVIFNTALSGAMHGAGQMANRLGKPAPALGSPPPGAVPAPGPTPPPSGPGALKVSAPASGPITPHDIDPANAEVAAAISAPVPPKRAKTSLTPEVETLLVAKGIRLTDEVKAEGTLMPDNLPFVMAPDMSPEELLLHRQSLADTMRQQNEARMIREEGAAWREKLAAAKSPRPKGWTAEQLQLIDPPDLMLMGPGPHSKFVSGGRFEDELRARGVKLNQSVPFETTENLDPLAGENSADWLGKIPAGKPVLLIRGVSKEELDLAIKTGELKSNRLLDDMPFKFASEVERRTGAPGPGEAVTWASADPRVAGSFGEHFVIFDASGLPAYSQYAPESGRINRLRSIGDEGASVAIRVPIPMSRVRHVGKWNTEGGGGAPFIADLRDYVDVDRTGLRPTFDGQLIEVIRKADDEAILQAQADMLRGARVNKGRNIEIDPDVAAWFENMPEVPKGFNPETRMIDTTGLGPDDLERLADAAADVGDQELVQTLLRTKAGLMGKGKKHGVVKPHAPMKRLKQIVSSKVAETARTRSMEATDNIDEAIDEAEGGIIENELGEDFASRIAAKSKKFIHNIAQVRQGETGDITSYSGMVKALKALKTPLVGVEGDKFKIAMPDQTIHTLTKDEVIARIQASLPPTEAVPMRVSSEAPPVEVPIADMNAYQQLNLPGVTREAIAESHIVNVRGLPFEIHTRPIPEPSEGVVLKESIGNRPSSNPLDNILEEGTIPETLRPKEGPRERVSKRLPKKHQAEHVKKEAAAKGIEITEAGKTILMRDTITGKTRRARSWNEAAKYLDQNHNNEGPVRTEAELKSLFRRRFAAVKTTIEANKMRAKYTLYSKYFPTRNEGLQPGETPLKSLEGIINRRRPPTIELSPDSAGTGGRFTLPPDVGGPTIPGGGPAIMDSHSFDDIRHMGWTRYFEQMKPWALKLEGRTKGVIPAYTKLFAPLDEARQKMQVFLADYQPELVRLWKPFVRNRAARERIGRYLEAEDKAAARVEIGIQPEEVEAADGLRRLWDKLYKELGVNAPYIDQYLPWRRLNLGLSERQALEQFYKNRPIPRSYVVTHELERETNGMFAREMDAFKLFHEYLLRGARKHYVAGPHAEAVAMIDGLRLPRELKDVRDHMSKFLDRMWGTTDASVRSLNNFVDSLMQKLGIETDKETRLDFMSLMLQLNTGAHLAFRAPLAIRNSFQVMFHLPMVGEKVWWKSVKKALTSEGKAEAVKANIIGNDPIPYGDEIFNPFSALTRFNRAGLKAYSTIDDFTRASAYHAGKILIEEVGLKYLRENWKISRFVDEAKLHSMFHPVEADTIARIVQSGDIPRAAEKAGQLLSENTNFIYRSGNAPELYRGVAGRLFGQFGTWPVGYLNYVRYLATFGTPKQRAEKIGRFLAFNTAIGSAGTMLGINLWKWLMFGPLVFTGGPLLQTAQDAAKVISAKAQGRDDDPEAQIALSRLKRNAAGELVPASAALRDIEQVLETAPLGTQAVLTRALLGQTPEQPVLSRRSRRRAIAEEVQQRRRAER